MSILTRRIFNWTSRTRCLVRQSCVLVDNRHISHEKLTFRQMTKEDIPGVRDVLHDHFFTESPPSKLLKIQPRVDNQYLIERLLSGTSIDMSVVVEDGPFNIVGTSLQNITYKSPTTSYRFSPLGKEATEKEKTMHYFQASFLEAIYESGDMFKRYDVDRYVRLRQGVVHKDYVGNGILQRLVRKIEEIANGNEIKCLVSTAVNPVSIKSLERLDFEKVSSCSFKDFVFEGKRVFNDVEREVVLLAKRL